MIARGLLVLGALTLTLTAAAQSSRPASPPSEVKKRTAALLKGLAFDAQLVGTTRLGLYLNTRSVGTVTITVVKAPAGSGAVYKATSKTVLRSGSTTKTSTETVFLGAAFDLVRSEGTHEGRLGAFTQKTTKRLKKGPDRSWGFRTTVTNSKGDRDSKELVAPDQGRNHGEIVGLILIGRKLDLKTPGRYRLQGVQWPEMFRGAWVGEPVWHPVLLEVSKPAQVTLRGVKRDLVRVKISRIEGDRGDQVLLYDVKGRFYGVEAVKSPMRMLVGSEPEVTAGLKKGGEVEKAIRAALRTYFKVTCGQEPVSALDRVMDWEALAKAKHDDPNLTGKTAAKIQAQLKKKHQAGSAPDAIVNTADMGVVSVAGDRATVALATSYAGVIVMKLVKHKAGWKIVALPYRRAPKDGE